MDNDKIIQIIPAPAGLMANFVDGLEEENFPVVCLGLLESGKVVPMIANGKAIWPAEDCDNKADDPEPNEMFFYRGFRFK